MRKIVFVISIFFLFIASFLFWYAEPFWRRKLNQIISWYERGNK